MNWARPYENGSPRVLFITGRESLREILELKQRFDFEYEVFALESGRLFWRKPKREDALTQSKAERKKELAGKLSSSYDLIVLGNLNFDSLPVRSQYKILKKAKQGTNLLALLTGKSSYFQRAAKKETGFPFEILLPYGSLPAFRDGCPLKVSQFGKGKIALLSGFSPPAYQMLTPPPEGDILHYRALDYEAYLLFAGQLIYHLSGKEPSIRFLREDKSLALARQELPQNLALSLLSQKKRTCRLFFTVLDRDDGRSYQDGEKNLNLKDGENPIYVTIDRIPAGNYFLALWLKEKGKVINFGCLSLEVASSLRVTELKLTTHSFRKEEAVTGTVKVFCENEGLIPSVSILQSDNFGRLLSTASVNLPVRGGPLKEVPFALPPPEDHLSILQHVRAELILGKEVCDKKKVSFSIRNLYPKNDDIRYVLWAGAPREDRLPGFLYPYHFKHAYEEGFDTHYTGFSKLIPLADLCHIPYLCGVKRNGVVGLGWSDKPEGNIRVPCLSDPEYLKGEAENIRKRVLEVKDYSTSEFSMGDERRFAGWSGTHELCFSPTCIARFQEFLRQEYKHIGELNREYGTDYGEFSQVKPVTLKEAKDDPKLVPVWVDFRRSVEDLWAGLHSFMREEIGKVFANGFVVGYEGSDNCVGSFTGADYWKLAKAMELNNTYDDSMGCSMFMNWAVSSFKEKGEHVGLGWVGGYDHTRSEVFNRYSPWQQLFRGANAFWIWTGSIASASACNVYATDLSFYPYFREHNRQVREIKEGIGKLVLESEREIEVALLYSASSVHLATCTSGFPSAGTILNSWANVLEDTGTGFEVISCEELSKGLLRGKAFSLLILPYCQALSKEECAEVLRFAAEGGVILADVRPAVADQHGKRYSSSPLDELFGVTQNTQGPSLGKGNLAPGELPVGCEVSFDASLRLSGGKPLARIGESPALIERRYQKGKSILLNFFIPYVGGFSAWKRGEEGRAVFKHCLSLAGVEERIKVSPEVDGLRGYRFRSQDAMYLALMQRLLRTPISYALEAEIPAREKTSIKLPKDFHVYDSRKATYLGYSREISAEIEMGQAEFYSLLPYKVEDISLKVSPTTASKGRILLEAELRLDSGKPGLHVFNLKVFSPKANELRYYGRNLVAPEGKGKAYIPLSLNEPAGTYRITLTDVASGLKKEAFFTVTR